MQVNEYQALAMRTSPEGHDRILNGCMGLIGESGEIVDLTKKWAFQSGDNAEFPTEKMIEECGDVLWYCAEVCESIHTNMAAYVSIDPDLYEENYSITRIVMHLSMLCNQLQDDLYDFSSNRVPHGSEILREITRTISFILIRFCNTTIEKCMERNIEKLKRRYPDGFDPERSLHREAE